MSRLRWPDSTNSVSEKPGTIQIACSASSVSEKRCGRLDFMKSDGLKLSPVDRCTCFVIEQLITLWSV